MSSTFNNSLRIALALVCTILFTLPSIAQTPFTCTDITPSSNTTVSGLSTNFSWTAMPNADQYQVLVGSATGVGNYNSGITSATNYLVTGYPTTGVQFWVTIKVMDQCGNIIKETSCPYTAPNIASNCTGTSYASIVAAAPSWNCFQTHNEYLGAYLAQHPDVAFWNQDTVAQCIDSIGPPTITGTVVSINSTGLDDATLISNAAAQAGSGGLVNGNGDTFRVSILNLNLTAHTGVTLKDINLVPFDTAGVKVVYVAKPDITILNCTLDLQSKNFRHGIEVRDGGDRFALVNSGVYNYLNGSNFAGGMLKLSEGVDDAYIVNNEFIHGVAIIANPNDTTSRVRGIFVTDNYTNASLNGTPKGGIIASNHIEDLQSNATGNDSDGIVFQGFGANLQYTMGRRMVVMANIGINSGKRLVKLQSGGVDLHSNFNWWKDLAGPLGERVTRAHYDNQGVSSTRWTNNSARSDSLGGPTGGKPATESFFMTMQNNRWYPSASNNNIGSDPLSDDNIFKCNRYEHNADTVGGRSSYAFMLLDKDTDPLTNPWPANSEITNNIVTGSGILKHVWFFRNTPTTTTQSPVFPHSPNTITVLYGTLYR